MIRQKRSRSKNPSRTVKHRMRRPLPGDVYLNHHSCKVYIIIEQDSEFWYKCFNITDGIINFTTIQALNIHHTLLTDETA